MAARLENILYVLNNGGVLRMIHNSGLVRLVSKDGVEFAVDGRSYQGFVAKAAKEFKRTEIGSLEQTTLVIQWQK
jgi:hypothetical protein